MELQKKLLELYPKTEKVSRLYIFCLAHYRSFWRLSEALVMTYKDQQHKKTKLNKK